MEQRVYLKPIEKEDIDYLLTLWKNPDIMDFWFSEPYMNREKFNATFEERQKDPSLRQFIAYVDEDRIGYANLHHINLRHRTAVFAVMVDPKNQGKGYAEEVVRRTVDYGFYQLNLNKINLDVVDFNEKAVYIYEKVGFKVEGKQEQQLFIQGDYHTSLSMGILRDRYHANNS